MDEKGGYWAVADSYVRQNAEGKVTSLTVCYPKREDEESVQLTFSDKANPIRVKLGMAEVAGLAEAVYMNRPWKAFHTFEKEGGKMETALNYRDSFINAERGAVKIALKLTENERMSLALTLKGLHFLFVERRCGRR